MELPAGLYTIEGAFHGRQGTGVKARAWTVEMYEIDSWMARFQRPGTGAGTCSEPQNVYPGRQIDAVFESHLDFPKACLCGP